MDFYYKKAVSIRKSVKLTINQVAEFLNKTRATISSWEHGVREPSKSDIIALSFLYDIKISEIST